MEQIKYHKLVNEKARNIHFTMIERPGPSKHLSTLKDCYQWQQRLQILHLDHRRHPQEPSRTFFEKYF